MKVLAKRNWIRDAVDHLKQYAQYAEEMRSVKRGFYVSSPHSTQSVINALTQILQEDYGDD